MASIKELAKAYEPTQIKNIADLPEVSVDINVLTEVATDNEGKEFTYNYIELENTRYRIPGVVIGDVKTLMGENPNLKKFKVKKTGTGLQTRYTTIPLG